MQYSKNDMFIDDVTVAASGTKVSDVLDNNFNRNHNNKMYLVVHTTGAVALGTVKFETSPDNATWTTLRTWTNAEPNKDGYAVLEKVPKGIERYMRVTVVNSSQTTGVKVRAAIVLEEDLDYDLADRDPKAVFDGTKTEAEVREEIA